MRNKTDNHAICGSWGGMCKALTPSGCSLSWEDRPFGGKALQPDLDGNPDKCRKRFTKARCCMAWMPYYNILQEVHDTYNDHESSTSLEEILSYLND